MKKHLLTLLLGISSIIAVSAEDVQINFEAKDINYTIDSVKVSNLTQNTSVIVPSGFELILSSTTGLTNVLKDFGKLDVYPNPFSDFSTVNYYSEKGGNVCFTIFSSDGKLIAKKKISLETGHHSFNISVPRGMYILSATENANSYYTKVISQSTAGTVSFEANGSSRGSSQKIRKASGNTIVLNYETGDKLLFKAYSGNNTTIQSEQITANKTISFDFVECKDADGNYYPVVQIGDQIWMAENLKYLPKVNKSDDKLSYEAQYYIYDYDGENLNDAKNTDSFKKYGVLYNAVAAENSCPTGWHLPSQQEWEKLSIFLGGDIIAGGKMKEKGLEHWLSPNSGATNESGFTALPGGCKIVSTFEAKGSYSQWWTSTDYNFNSKILSSVNNRNSSIDYDSHLSDKSAISVRYILGTLPVVKTSDITLISTRSAQSGAKIISNENYNIIKKGVCWSPLSRPNIAELDFTNDGSGIDSFISGISGLTPNTTYHVRAYVQFAEGVSYGDEIIFTTQAGTLPLTSITGTLTANGDSYFNNIQTWTASITVDENDLSKVWIKNIIPEVRNNTAVYGIINEERTEIKIPVNQTTDTDISYRQILLKGFFGDTSESIPNGGYISGLIDTNGVITLQDEFGVEVFKDTAATQSAGWYNMFKVGVTFKKQ